MVKQKVVAADADPEDLYDGLTPEEWDELYNIQTQLMNFKGVVAGLDDWENVIDVLEMHIQKIEDLKTKGARIFDNCEGLLFYHVPSHYGAFATYEGKDDSYYQFKLHTGKTVRVPIDSHHDPLADSPIGIRLVVLLTSEFEVLNFMVSDNQGPSQARSKPGGVKNL